MGQTLIWGCFLYCASHVLIPLVGDASPTGVATLIAQALLSGMGVTMENVSIGAIIAGVVPTGLRATVRGTFQFISFGMRPVASLASGVLMAEVGLRPALWIGAVGAVPAFVWIMCSPVTRFRLPG